MGKREVHFVFILVLLIISISLISASAPNWLKTITGRVPSQPQNVSVTVVGANPVIISVPSGISAIPVEETFVSAIFTVNVTDPDGVNDINDSSVRAEFTKAGQTTRTGNCPWQADINSTTANFTCTIVMWYFDGDGSWNMRVEGKDFGNGTLMNGTNTFTYGLTKGMKISPSALSWPSVASGASNQNASNDPTIINNTGNYNGTINITAYDLLGETISSEKIPANNFSVSSTNGLECSSGTALVNSSQTLISVSNSNPGNLSAGGGAGQEDLYYCIPSVPIVSSQVYSTSQGGSWVIGF